MCARGIVWQLETEDVESALRARSRYLEVVKSHEGWPLDDYAASVVYTELVGNVLRYAAPPIKITLHCDGAEVRLNVSDRGPGFDFAAPPKPSALSEGGRGLFLVSHYAGEVEVQRHEGKGTTVIAVLVRAPV